MVVRPLFLWKTDRRKNIIHNNNKKSQSNSGRGRITGMLYGNTYVFGEKERNYSQLLMASFQTRLSLIVLEEMFSNAVLNLEPKFGLLSVICFSFFVLRN